MIADDFWDERPELKHVRDFARSRRANPLSTLGVVLVRATCMIPPYVVLPPIIGGRVALNLGVALVGESGRGKGASEHAGRDAIHYIVEDPELPEFSIGSGEGIARTLMEAPTALFVIPEVDTIRSLFSRKGQTLEAELRKLYMGERLGFANANRETRTRVDALSYRAGLIIGVQPLRAGILLDGADGGTPQRFLWVPTQDRQMPEERPDEIGPLDIIPSYWQPGAMHDLKVPSVAYEEIDRHQVDSHRGEPGIDPLDGHALLTRLKVAAGLMVLAGRSYMDESDWDLARRIMLVSKWTRDDIRRTVDEYRYRQNIARAAAMAERAEYSEARKVRRARDAILRGVTDDWQAASDIRRSFRSDLRGYFPEAASQLILDGLIEESDRNGGTVYRRVHPVHPVHPSLTSGNDGPPRGGRPSTPIASTDPLPGEIPEQKRDNSQTRRAKRTPAKQRSKRYGTCGHCRQALTADEADAGICIECETDLRNGKTPGAPWQQ